MLGVLVVAILGPVIVLLSLFERDERNRHAEIVARADALADRLFAVIDARDARIRELEDALYTKHAAVLELPNIHRAEPEPAPVQLSASVCAFLDGFVDVDARAEYEAEAQRIVAADPSLSSAAIIEKLTSVAV